MPSSEVDNSKRTVRRQCRQCRETLPPHLRTAASQAVLERVLQLPEFGEADVVHTYVSSVPNELDTQSLIRRCLDLGRRIVIPVVEPRSRTLRHATIRSLDELAPRRWGLLEPAPERTRWFHDLALLDLILVPGLAFDRHGHRLGLGGGYYDRFLARTRALRVGITYDELLLDELPTGKHDQSMDLIMTPSTVLRCARA